MHEEYLPFRYEDRQDMSEMLTVLNEVLKDSDATEEKKKIREFIRMASDDISIMVIGESGAGKTGLLKNLFGEELFESGRTETITEYHYGEENTSFLLDDGARRVFRTNRILNGVLLLDTPGADRIPLNMKEAYESRIRNADVVFAVVSADYVGCFDLWEYIENTELRKLVFVITKTEALSEKQLFDTKVRLNEYMKDAGVSAPIFLASEPEDLKSYVNDRILEDNPRLKKQRQNLIELKSMVDEVKSSFELRKKQLTIDIDIMRKIDGSLQDFSETSRDKIEALKGSLRTEIDQAITEYRKEVIGKLDPQKIRERFPNGYTDFVEYLNFVNDSYHKKMTDNVNTKTRQSVQSYLSDLETIFDEATGFIRTRENLIALEDRFYGSISAGKQEMISKVDADLQATREYYGLLTQASDELFYKLWKERSRYDRRVKNGAAIGAAGGAAGGAAAVYGIAAAATAGSASAAATTAAAILSAAGLWPVVAAVVGGVTLGIIAKKISSAKNASELEDRVREAIREFDAEIEATRADISDQVMNTIDQIFRRELVQVDRSFADFRISVNIEERNLPEIEAALENVQRLYLEIDKVEKAGLIENAE